MSRESRNKTPAYDQLIYEKQLIIHQKEQLLHSIMPEKLDSHMPENETRPLLQCQIKINSNWIKNLM